MLYKLDEWFQEYSTLSEISTTVCKVERQREVVKLNFFWHKQVKYGIYSNLRNIGREHVFFFQKWLVFDV